MRFLLPLLLLIAGCGAVVDDPCPTLSYQQESDLLTIINADRDIGVPKSQELTYVDGVCQGDYGCTVCMISAINAVYGG